jgi:hypothetical protein
MQLEETLESRARLRLVSDTAAVPGISNPPLDPQHRNKLGKYGMKLRSHPQHYPQQAATEPQRTEVKALKR